MFSPHDSPAVNDWFQRFDAASRRLPAEERTSQREEIQQHLDGLVAAEVAQGQPSIAAWESALKQFGDPTQIGRRMYQEWQQGRTGFRADMRAILFGIGLQAMRGIVVQCLFFLYPQNGRPPHPDPHFLWVISFPATAFIGFGIGRKYPHQALKSALLWPFLWPVVLWTEVAILCGVGWMHMLTLESLPRMLLDSMHYNVTTALLSCAAAYLASVTKRGWYRPSLADFKLTLPRRRLRFSR